MPRRMFKSNRRSRKTYYRRSRPYRSIGYTPEKKRLVYVANGTVSDSGTLGDLTQQIVQGTGSNERIGSRLKLYSMYMNYGWIQADNPIQTCRVMIVYAKQALTSVDFPNNGSAGIEEMFDTTKGKVLYDKFVSFNNQITGTAMQKMGYRVKLNLRLRPVQWKLGDTTGTPLRGNLYLWLISDSSVVTHPSIQYGLSISYYDA